MGDLRNPNLQLVSEVRVALGTSKFENNQQEHGPYDAGENYGSLKKQWWN